MNFQNKKWTNALLNHNQKLNTDLKIIYLCIPHVIGLENQINIIANYTLLFVYYS